MLKIMRYEGWMLAKSPIHHGGNEKTGSTPVLRTVYLYNAQLGDVLIPYVNGNAIRGKLRRLIMRDFLELISMKVEDLGVKLYHVFFTGGALESTEETYGSIDLGMRKKVYELLPPVALMGCAIGNQIITGKLKVGHAFPVCKEYKDFLPVQFQNDSRIEMYVRTFTDESFRTRKDDLKAERAEDEQAIQMKIDYECFVPGTLFYHWFSLEMPTPVEESCFGRMIELFRESPYIGGMSSIGNGEVAFEYTPKPADSVIYRSFLTDSNKEIKEFINELKKKL